jgi:hypothetical protein
MENNMKSLLEKLNIQPVNAGACTGPDGWLMDSNGKELVSYNPATGRSAGKRSSRLRPKPTKKSLRRRRKLS